MKNLLFACTLIFAVPLQERHLNTDALHTLTTELGISPDQTQEKWLRKGGQERWEMSELSPEDRSFVLNWATEQGLYSEWKPIRTHYHAALILGATTSRMEMRLNHLKKLWNDGVHFNEIVWLTGDRPLDKRVDGLLGLCHNESDAARSIWESAELPKEMRALPVFFVAVPMKGAQRPNTADTLHAWIATSSPCVALFVSDQPFCGYQHAVIHGCLPSDYDFDIVGPGIDPHGHPAAAAITLDTIARWIYQDELNKK